IRKAVKKVSNDNLLIGEVWEDASSKISYGYRRHYFQGQELDGVMNYPFKEAIINYVVGGKSQFFENEVMKIVENYPKQALDTTMNLIDSHDTIRALTLFGAINSNDMSREEKRNFKMSQEDYNKAKQVLKMAATLQFMLPGIPSIYYGDEGGMQGFEDPMNRLPMPWDGLDKDLQEHYRALGKIRRNFKKALCGKIRFESQEENLLVFKRYDEDNQEIVIIANNYSNYKKYYLFEDSINLLTKALLESGWVGLPPNSVMVLESVYRDGKLLREVD
ncbi:MAG: alpha-amylase family glycosyl hydrolase, partial [Clostridia bacterium]